MTDLIQSHGGKEQFFRPKPAANMLFAHKDVRKELSTVAETRPTPRFKLDGDIAFLNKYGIGYPALWLAQERANLFSERAADVLINQGLMAEIDYFRCVALELGLPFEMPSQNSSDGRGNPTPFFKAPAPHDLTRMARMVMNEGASAQGQAQSKIYLAPDCRQLNAMKELLKNNPSLASRLVVTTFTSNRESLEKRSEPSLLRMATRTLRERFPDFSALRVISVPQALVLFITLQLLALLVILSPHIVAVTAHLIASGFYVSCISLRLLATHFFVTTNPKTVPKTTDFNRQLDHTLPVYTVLVALYQEATQVDDLVNALLRLDWPRERLEIKLVCEADDWQTLLAVEQAIKRTSQRHIALVRVPAGNPRTKPKALNYALPLCTGRLLVIYDAEDRPSPLQLREAHRGFQTGPKELACQQAPLVIYNHQESWLSKLFAIEYSSLFDGLLPYLANQKGPVPLGGTSNHFVRAVLEEVGAWDPYNVTEDADLGIRLARAGYQIGTLHSPTYEEAPITFGIWLRQRTRWFKGWFQTWLVHMRHPIALSRDLGWRGTIVFHLMITGMIISALVHPVLLYLIGSATASIVGAGLWNTILQNPLFLLDIVTILAGYLTFAMLAWRTLPLRQMGQLKGGLIYLPVYWLLLSAAAWRALWHLMRRPHEWEKTPHRLRTVSSTSVLV